LLQWLAHSHKRTSFISENVSERAAYQDTQRAIQKTDNIRIPITTLSKTFHQPAPRFTSVFLSLWFRCQEFQNFPEEKP
jgi:hypothetical protein